MEELRQKIERNQAQIDVIHEEHGSDIEMQSEIDRLKMLKNNCQKRFEKLKKDAAELEKQVKKKQRKSSREGHQNPKRPRSNRRS